MAVETILPEALVTLEEAKLYLKKAFTDDGVAIPASAATVYEDEVIMRMINYVTGEAEAYTCRHLKSRTYDATNGYLYADGEDGDEVDASEYPVTAVSRVEELDSAGASVRELSLSGVIFDSAGLIRLRSDTFAAGSLNHRITGVAGILTTSSEWKALTGAALRWIQVLWQDHKDQYGRAVSVSVGGQTVSPSDTAMPRDVQAVLDRFRRIL